MAESPLEAEVGEPIPPPGVIAAPEENGAPEPETELAPAQQAGGPVLLNDRYLIDTATPLPDLDRPSAKAYAVEDRRDLSRSLFGLVCTPGLPTRTNAMSALRDAGLDGLLPMVEYDTIDWPPLGQRSMVVIYEKPKGGRVLDAMEAGTFKCTEYDFPGAIMGPLFTGLRNIAALDIAHRAINPHNIFFMDAEMQTIVLGDCVTSPPGFDQPPMFEPTERGMAQPGGRGMGGTADDIYAFGATMVVLMLGHNPIARLGEDDMLRAKMEQGSYAAICANARLPMPLLEPLRGMLNDTVALRWGLDELTGWLAGEKQPPLQQTPVVRSSFPYLFEGHEFNSPRTLARYLSRHRETAMQAINDDALVTWLRRGVEDPHRADNVKATLETAALHQDSAEGSEDYIISKTCMVLDPQAPIHFKGMSFMPDGFGPALAVELLRRGDVSVPIEALSIEIPLLWYHSQRVIFAGASVQQIEFATWKGYLSSKEPGYGYERCLYEINASLPCQSELLIKNYVIEIEELLPALDEISNKVDANVKPIDRHISAFIAARFNEDILPHLKALASPKEETATIGMLSLLAFLQWKLRIKSLYGLSSWVGGLLGPAINTYNSRTTRRKIEKEIPSLVRKGSLPELFDLIDNAENRRIDTSGYETACAEYLQAEMEIRDIEGSGEALTTKAERTGKQTAAVISIVLAMMVSSVLVISEMF